MESAKKSSESYGISQLSSNLTAAMTKDESSSEFSESLFLLMPTKSAISMD